MMSLSWRLFDDRQITLEVERAHLNYRYPHAVLNVMVELASQRGDCASAIVSAAKGLGFEAGERLLKADDLTCSSENALANIVDKSTFDTVKAEIAKREQEGSLLPCQVSPEQTVSSCFQKCPLLFDLFLQAHDAKTGL